MGQLETPRTILHRSGKGPFDMAKELAFEQISRYGGTVDPNQRPVAAPTSGMNSPGNQLLARAGLTADQDVGPSRRHHGNLLDQFGHRRAVAHDIAVVHFGLNLFLQVLVLKFQPAFERLHLFQRIAQLLFGALTLANIAKQDHRSH